MRLAQIVGINTPYVFFYHAEDVNGEKFTLSPYQMEMFNTRLGVHDLTIGMWVKITSTNRAYEAANGRLVPKLEIEITKSPVVPILCRDFWVTEGF